MSLDVETRTSEVATLPARFLGPEDVVAFETQAAPRYLSFFAERLVGMLAPSPDARVCHLQCRTGFPDQLLLTKLPGAHIYGCDSSEHAVELARAKAREAGMTADYRVVDVPPLPFPGGAFSHAFTIHPLAAPAERKLIVDELARLLAPQGQALVAMPLRGSFAEIADLLRECALKTEVPALNAAVEAAVQLRPTEEELRGELAAAGFDFVDTELVARTLKFSSGRELFEDAATRLLLLPEFLANAEVELDVGKAFSYVRGAIDKYWSDGSFELTVNVGVASGRRR